MIFPRRVQAVIFDMDGLLFDTEIVFFHAMQAAGQEAGCDISRELFLSMLGRNREYSYFRLREFFGATFPAEAFHARCRQHMLALLEGQLRLKAGAGEMLDLLDRLGMPRAIATSSMRASVDHHLAAVGMSDRFHAIVANGDYTNGKPHPEPYIKAATQLGINPSDCLALEDSYNGVRSAAGAGMMTVMVPDLLQPTYEMRGLCTYIADDLHAVRRHLTAQH